MASLIRISTPALVLLTGGALMLATPLRATAARHGNLPASSRASLPASLALAVTAALAAFFLSYLSVFVDDAATVPLTRIPEGAPGHRLEENFTIVGLGEYLVTTGVLVVAALHAYRLGRRIPTGLITMVVAVVALSSGVLTEFARPATLLGAIIGGLAADALVGAVSVRAPQLTAVVAGAAIPALVWPGQLAGLAVTVPLAWSVELWAGIVSVTVLAGAIIGALIRPWPSPPASNRA